MSKNARNSISLLKSTTEANAVSWSQDQRIAATASQTIYVLVSTLIKAHQPYSFVQNSLQTLKRPQFSPKRDASSPAGGCAAPQAADGIPPLSISTAHAPLREKLTLLDMSDVQRGSLTVCPPAAKWNLMDLVDPLLVGEGDGQSHDLFKASYWSPAGYSHLGGYVEAWTPSNVPTFWDLSECHD